jgi:hypothetical protein
MFYYYEIRSCPLKEVELKEETCPLCKHKGKVVLSIMQKYMWMWGPIVPQHKYGVLECDACEAIIPADKWNDEVKGVFKVYKSQAATPSRLWRGARVFLIFFLLIFGFAGLIKLGVLKDNPFGFKNDMETIEQTSEALKDIKKETVLYVSVHKNELNKKTGQMDTKFFYTIFAVVDIKDDLAFVKKYDGLWENFQDQYDIKVADLDHMKFIPVKIPVLLDQIKRNKQLMQPEKKGEKFTGPFGKIEGIIK